MDYFLKIKPLINKNECGDFGIIKEFHDHYFLGLVDISGHGKEAVETAVLCKKFLEENFKTGLSQTIKDLHTLLKGKRGAVMVLCFFNPSSGTLTYCGVGNIMARLFGPGAKRLTLESGIVGYEIRTPREKVVTLNPEDVLLLHTDGIREHFNLEDCRELLRGDAKFIAENIIGKFGKGTDDSACLVLRWQK